MDLIKILKQFNIVAPKVQFLNESSDNKSYLIFEGTFKRVLRISKKNINKSIEFELELINFLRSKGINTPMYFQTNKKKFFYQKKGLCAILFSFMEGSKVRGLADKEKIIRAGELLGKIHASTLNVKLKSRQKRNIFTEFKRLLKYKTYIRTNYINGSQIINEVMHYFKFGEKNSRSDVIIHNDFRPQNILFDSKNNVLNVVDFDWACYGNLEKDLGLAIAEWTFPDNFNKPWVPGGEHFLEGYNRFSPKKFNIDNQYLIKWICFSCISDTATYIIDHKVFDNNLPKKQLINSYMYKKFMYYKNYLNE